MAKAEMNNQHTFSLARTGTRIVEKAHKVVYLITAKKHQTSVTFVSLASFVFGTEEFVCRLVHPLSTCVCNQPLVTYDKRVHGSVTALLVPILGFWVAVEHFGWDKKPVAEVVRAHSLGRYGFPGHSCRCPRMDAVGHHHQVP